MKTNMKMHIHMHKHMITVMDVKMGMGMNTNIDLGTDMATDIHRYRHRHRHRAGTYTGWGSESWTKLFFFLQYIGLHVFLKLMVRLKSTGWCVLDSWLTIYSILT